MRRSVVSLLHEIPLSIVVVGRVTVRHTREVPKFVTSGFFLVAHRSGNLSTWKAIPAVHRSGRRHRKTDNSVW